MKLAQSIATRRRAIITGLALSLCFLLLPACSGYITPTAVPAPQATSTVTATTSVVVTTSASELAVNTGPAVVAAAASKAKNEQAVLRPTAVVTVALPEVPGLQHLSNADTDYFVHIPGGVLNRAMPYQVVVAVHGMSNEGRSFSQPLIEYADEYGLVLVAPTMKYDNNYSDPARVAANDGLLLPQLNRLIQSLPARLAHPVNSRVFMFGFSRGGQIVHRYATFYPEEVLGVAAMSAGSYTLPVPQFKRSDQASKVDLRFPFGTADLAQYTGHNLNMEALLKVNFWLGVGGSDIAVKDVPEAWIPYLGSTRVERASRYYQALQAAGIQATFKIFPNVGHAVCTEMKQDAFAFFNKLYSAGL